jgi:hypothetical protein
VELNLIEVKTGNTLWTTKVGDEAWSSNLGTYYKVIAYGNIYVGGYDGEIYCIDIETGDIEWTYSAGEGTETPFQTWAFYDSAAGGDGKIYASTSEHTPSQPHPRFNKVHCFDAFTGEQIWTISSPMALALGQGYLIGTSENDGNMYCFGKGQTETSVMAAPKVTAKGSGVVIEGSVLDMSPAQAGTPAVSDSSMGPWMEYKHMQKPKPWDTTGVTVKLTAFDPNGNYQDIGTVTSDFAGNFGKTWNPPVEGTYLIIAEFEGSESYWPSTATTYLEVGPAPTPLAPIEPEPTPEAPFITTEIAIIAAVAVAVVIGIAAFWALRKRK